MSWAVIGAGYSGIGAAAAMLAEGIDVDVLDKRDDVGGLWLDGVHPSVRLITTNARSAYPGRPMTSADVFPSGTEMLTYLRKVAAETGVRERLINRDVVSVAPADGRWSVDGVMYDGVVLATGLFSDPYIPDLPGNPTIPTLHTSEYRDVGELGVDVQRPWFLPDLATRVAMDLSVRALSAFWRRGRLDEPRHLLLSEAPVIHSALLPLIGNGSIPIRPNVARIDGPVACGRH